MLMEKLRCRERSSGLSTCESKVAETGEESFRPSDSLSTIFSPSYVLHIHILSAGSLLNQGAPVKLVTVLEAACIMDKLWL